MTRRALSKRLFCVLNDTITKTTSSWQCSRHYSPIKDDVKKKTYYSPITDDVKKKTYKLIHKLLILNRDYWHVVYPIHFGTSVIWLGGIYYMVTTGVDVVAIMESWHFKEWMMEPLKATHHVGYYALSLTLYQLIAPIRTIVSFTIAAFAVDYLAAMGYIKPKPIKAPKKLKQIKDKIFNKTKELEDMPNQPKEMDKGDNKLDENQDKKDKIFNETKQLEDKQNQPKETDKGDNKLDENQHKKDNIFNETKQLNEKPNQPKEMDKGDNKPDENQHKKD